MEAVINEYKNLIKEGMNTNANIYSGDGMKKFGDIAERIEELEEEYPELPDLII